MRIVSFLELSFGKFRVVNCGKGHFLLLGLGPYNGPKFVGLMALFRHGELIQAIVKVFQK